MGFTAIFTLLSAVVAVTVCTGVAARQVLQGPGGLELQVISASQFSKENNLWVYLVKRLNHGKSLAKPAKKVVNLDATYRREVRNYEDELNKLIPKVVSKTNSIVYNAEEKINQQYSTAEKQLDSTVQAAAGNSPKDSVKKLVKETIPKAVATVNDVVHNAQLNINSKIWQGEVLLNNEVTAAEAKLDQKLKSKKKIDPKQITKIIDQTQTNVQKQLADDGKALNGYIDFGNKIVADNIALVETAVQRELPKDVSDKVNKDIKTASVEIDDSISQGSAGVRKEVDEGIKQWHRLVPGWAKKN